MLIASMFNYKIDKIKIYPFGGITKYNELLNTSMLKEFLVLLGGPLFQEILYIFLLVLYKNNLISDINFNIIDVFHKTLFYFNFLPIIPLDGSKLFSLLLEKTCSYKKSNIITIIISFISIFLLVIFEKRLIIVFLSIILIKNIFYEISIHNYKFNRFLLERYLYNFKFKKGKKINSIKEVKRSREHMINYKNKLYTEKEYLNTLYNNKN